MAGTNRSTPSITSTRPPQSPVAIPNASPELIQQFLINQGKQIDSELNKQNIQLKEIELGDSYAHAALKAQVEDRADSRKHEREMKKTRYRNWLIAGLSGIAVSAGTIIACVAYGQASLALELVKTVGPPLVTAVAGVVGGYSAGIQKGKKQSKEEAAEAAGQR